MEESPVHSESSLREVLAKDPRDDRQAEEAVVDGLRPFGSLVFDDGQHDELPDLGWEGFESALSGWHRGWYPSAHALGDWGIREIAEILLGLCDTDMIDCTRVIWHNGGLPVDEVQDGTKSIACRRMLKSRRTADEYQNS